MTRPRPDSNARKDTPMPKPAAPPSEVLRDAVETVAVVFRQVATLTDTANARTTLVTPQDVHHVVFLLSEAVRVVPQVLDQLERRLLDMAALGHLRDDRDPGEAYLGPETAKDTVAALGGAVPAVNVLVARLAAVQSHSIHLDTAASELAGGGQR